MLGKNTIQEPKVKRALAKTQIVYPLSVTLYSRIYVAETDIGKFILKERYSEAFRHECKILRLLARKKFPYIPRFFGTITFGGKRYIVQEYIEGKKFEDEKKLFYEHLDTAAEILAQLHSITQKKKKTCFSFIHREFKTIEHFFNQTMLACKRAGKKELLTYLVQGERHKKILAKLITKYKRPLQYPIHPSLTNRETEFIIAKKKKIYLLDWEYIEFGDYAHDIANVKYVFPRMDLRTFMDAYRHQKRFASNVYLRIFLYLFIILIKEFNYYISDIHCCSIYKKIPPRLLTVLARTTLQTGIKRMEDAYRTLHSFKYP